MSETKYIVERVEDEIASLENVEDGEIWNFIISEIPFAIEEGDVLIFENDNWQRDEEEKKRREERMRDKMKEVWE